MERATERAKSKNELLTKKTLIRLTQKITLKRPNPNATFNSRITCYAISH